MTTIALNKTDIKYFGIDTIRVNSRKLSAGRVEQIAKTGSQVAGQSLRLRLYNFWWPRSRWRK
jgi:hypothetical protein